MNTVCILVSGLAFCMSIVACVMSRHTRAQLDELLVVLAKRRAS